MYSSSSGVPVTLKEWTISKLDYRNEAVLQELFLEGDVVREEPQGLPTGFSSCYVDQRGSVSRSRYPAIHLLDTTCSHLVYRGRSKESTGFTPEIL